MSKKINGTIRGRDDARIPRPVLDVVLDDFALVEFLTEIQKNRSVKNKPLISLFRARSVLSPKVRLVANLKNLLGCLALNDSVINILDGGLSESEETALLDLEDGEVSEQALAAAHALLNIKERQELLPVFTEVLKNQSIRGFIEIEDTS